MELNHGIEINIKASLSVDDDTFKTCMNLMKIYCKSQCENAKGMVIKFDDEYYGLPMYSIIDSDAQMNLAMYGFIPESEG